MKMQADLFSDETIRDVLRPDPEAPQVMAAPCAWLDSANKPCRRLGHEPVMIEGKQLVHRGHRVVHCVPECFRVNAPKIEEVDGDA